jgi:acetyl esterase/lipase
VGLIGASARSYRDVLRRGVAERERSGTDRQHPIVAALDRVAEELIERAERRERTMTISLPGERVGLELAAWEQGFHTPPLALATMLHRGTVLAHGTADVWASHDESALLAQVLTEAGNAPLLQLVDGAGHDLEEADDAAIGAFVAGLSDRMLPRELPPVLMAIEEMS